MKRLLQKIKYRYLFFIVIFGITLQLLFGLLQFLSLEFPLEKSENPRASKHFVNAMNYKVAINSLHNYIDYDNALMQPLLNKMNEEYKKGKNLLPKNSAEDVYWYVILYRGIYGIGGTPDKYDMSIAYKNRLSIEEYKTHYKEIKNKIKRLAVDDFNFDIPRITNYKYEFMVNLIDEIMTILDILKVDDKKILRSYEYSKDVTKIYGYYEKFSEKYLPQSNKKNENRVDNIVTKIQIFSYMLAFKIHQTRKANCQAIEYKKLMKNIKILKNMSLDIKYKNETFYYKSIFNSLAIYEKVKAPEKHCPNLKKEASEILKYFNSDLEKNYTR